MKTELLKSIVVSSIGKPVPTKNDFIVLSAEELDKIADGLLQDICKHIDPTGDLTSMREDACRSAMLSWIAHRYQIVYTGASQQCPAG